VSICSTKSMILTWIPQCSKKSRLNLETKLKI
jgi:hypothetical protein